MKPPSPVEAHAPKVAPLAPQRARAILDAAVGTRVIVLGDMVVDEHIIGRARAIAREAPVPVIEQDARLLVPGGATNVANNLRALGCEVLVAGVVGADAMADALRSQLEARGIHTAGVMHDATRNTSVKTRIWAGGDRQRPQRMVARVDLVDRRELERDVEEQLILYLEGAVPQARAVVISDYENGVVSPGVVRALLPLAHRAGAVITVDAHGALHRFPNVTLVTPNQPEAERELGREFGADAEILEGASELRRRLNARAVLVTLGERGMALASGDGPGVFIPVAPNIQVADPTGAGDTVAAAMTAGLVGGAGELEAALLADLAARVVVRKLGAAVASGDDVVAEAHGPAA